MRKIIVFSLFVLLLLYLSRKENIPKCSAHFACKDILSELLSWMFKTTLYTVSKANILWLFLNQNSFMEVPFVWCQSAMILKPWYGKCLLTYIMSLYILLFTLYIFYFPDQYSHCNSAFSSLTFSLVSMTSTNEVPTIQGKRIMDLCELPHMHLLLPEMKFLPMKAGWRDAPLALQDLAEAIS